MAGTPTWIAGGDHFWYSKSVKEGTEFVLVDAAAGTKKPAFDHAKLAAAISTASGGHYTAYKLPFAAAAGGRGGGGGRGAGPAPGGLTFHDGERSIEFGVSGFMYTCSLSDYACSKGPRFPLRPLPDAVAALPKPMTTIRLRPMPAKTMVAIPPMASNISPSPKRAVAPDVSVATLSPVAPRAVMIKPPIKVAAVDAVAVARPRRCCNRWWRSRNTLVPFFRRQMGRDHRELQRVPARVGSNEPRHAPELRRFRRQLLHPALGGLVARFQKAVGLPHSSRL